MDNNSINISFEELNETANRIAKTSGEVETILCDVKTTIDTLNQSWDSQASMDLINKFQNLQKVIEGHKSTIDAYATFLHKTVETYTDTEEKISSIAMKFDI